MQSQRHQLIGYQVDEHIRHRAVERLEGEPSQVARTSADATQRHLGHALGGKAGNEAAAQVAHAADVDVAHRVVVSTREDPGCPAASETPGGCPPAWPRRWGPRPAPGLASKWILEPASLPHGGSWRSGNGRVGRGTRRRRSLRPGPRHGLGAGEHALPALAGQRGRGRAGRPVRQQHERRHAAPALHAALRQQHLRQPRKQPRLLAVWLQSPGADQSHAAPLLLGPEPCDSAPVPAAQDARAACLRRATTSWPEISRRPTILRRTSENECCATCKKHGGSRSRSTG